MVEGISIAWWAALLGLALAIVLILKNSTPHMRCCSGPLSDVWSAERR